MATLCVLSVGGAVEPTIPESTRHGAGAREPSQAAGDLSARRACLSPGLDWAFGRVAPPGAFMPEHWPVWSSRNVISVRRNPYTSLPDNSVSAHKLIMPGLRNLKAAASVDIYEKKEKWIH